MTTFVCNTVDKIKNQMCIFLKSYLTLSLPMNDLRVYIMETSSLSIKKEY